MHGLLLQEHVPHDAHLVPEPAMEARGRNGRLDRSILPAVLLLCFHADTARHRDKSWARHPSARRINFQQHIAWEDVVGCGIEETEGLRLHREALG